MLRMHSEGSAIPWRVRSGAKGGHEIAVHYLCPARLIYLRQLTGFDAASKSVRVVPSDMSVGFAPRHFGLTPKMATTVRCIRNERLQASAIVGMVCSLPPLCYPL